jgi:hypothetical protein
MKPEFHDNYKSAHVDPLEPTHADFDWATVYAHLDGEQPKEEADPPPVTHKEMAQILAACFRWALDFDHRRNNQYNCRPTELIGRRLIALAWVTNPASFDGASLASICKRLKVRGPSMAKLTAAASRHFGIVNRGQAHGWNRGEAGNGKGSISHALPGRRGFKGDNHPNVAPRVIKMRQKRF